MLEEIHRAETEGAQAGNVLKEGCSRQEFVVGAACVALFVGFGGLATPCVALAAPGLSTGDVIFPSGSTMSAVRANNPGRWP